MTRAFTKTTSPGTGDYGRVFVTIEWDGRKLSLQGVEGPTRNGNARGSCGQIDPKVTSYSEGWDEARLNRLREVWKRWHLNNIRAGCEHQRAEGWNKRPIFPDQPTSAYVKHPDGCKGWNMLTWLPVEKGGLLSAPCPTCGYKYGTSWLHEDVPEDVIAFLASLPDSGTDDWGRKL